MDKKQKLKKLRAALGGEQEGSQQDTSAETNKRLDLLIEAVTDLRTEVKANKVTFPENVKINNLDEIPSEIEVKNFPELQQVEVTNFPEPVEAPEVQKVEVVNEFHRVEVINQYKAPQVQKVEVIKEPEKPDVAPSWLPSFVHNLLDGLATIADKISKRTFTIQYAKGERQKPQLVVMVDPKTGKAFGKPEIVVNVSGGGAPSSSGSGGGTGYDTVWLKDIAGNKIDPAKDDTLLTLLTELQQINGNTSQLELSAENVNLNTDQLEAKLDTIYGVIDGIENQLDTVTANLSNIDNNTNGTEALLQGVIDELVGRTNTGKQVQKATVALSASGTVLTPASGKKIRILSLKFSLNTDLTHVAFRFTAGGTDFAKFLNPKAGGYYGDNNHPDYNEGGVNEIIHADISGTGTAQINLTYIEV